MTKIFFVALFALPFCVGAAEPVRSISLKDGRSIKGRVVDYVPASLTIEDGKATITISVAELGTNEISRLPKEIREPYDQAIMWRTNCEHLLDQQEVTLSSIERTFNAYSNYIAGLEKELAWYRDREDKAAKGIVLENLGFSRKVLSDSYGWAEFSWKLLLRNNGKSDLKGTLKVSFFDKQEYLLQAVYVNDFVIGSGKEKTASDTIMMESALSKSIESVDVRLIQ